MAARIDGANCALVDALAVRIVRQDAEILKKKGAPVWADRYHGS